MDAVTPLICAARGTSNRGGRHFCSECGAGLVSGCPECGAPAVADVAPPSTPSISAARDPAAYVAPNPNGVLLNERLARQLDAKTGDQIVIRVPRPSAMPRDLVLATNDDLSVALRVEVQGILPDAGFGRFGLRYDGPHRLSNRCR